MFAESAYPPVEMRRDSDKSNSEPGDRWIRKFLAHLATDRGASVYTQRNYRDALNEFVRWHREERQQLPLW